MPIRPAQTSNDRSDFVYVTISVENEIMKNIARNVAATATGFFIGSVINFSLITVGMSVFPLPEGTDVTSMDSVRAAMGTLPPQNFLFPLAGHALGTLVGAFLAAKLAIGNRAFPALAIGGLFLLGGIAMILNCGGPIWFATADLLLSYIPMAWLGKKLAVGRGTSNLQSDGE
ncbi:MAG: hypothetical protein U0892_00930 [Pirellulales bacterium]